MATTTYTTTEPSSSTTLNYELHALSANAKNDFKPISKTESSTKQQPLEILDDQPPSNAVEALQRWNTPRINMWRVLATFWSFFVVGLNDGSYGALIPFVSLFASLVEIKREFLWTQIEKLMDGLAGNILRSHIYCGFTRYHMIPFCPHAIKRYLTHPSLPLTLRRLHPRSFHQQSGAYAIWPTRCSHSRTTLSPRLLHSHGRPSSLPRLDYYVHIRWIWKWTY